MPTFRRALLANAALLAFALATAAAARAGYIVTFSESGSGVVAGGGGTINLAGLSFSGNFPAQVSFVFPSIGAEATGASANISAYAGAISGPISFGPGSAIVASAGTGDLVGLGAAGGVIVVPQGYVSGGPLSDTATYAGQTFATLGLTPGSYVYSFGSGANADTFTIKVGAVPTPEPAGLALFGAGLLGLGLGLLRRRR